MCEHVRIRDVFALSGALSGGCAAALPGSLSKGPRPRPRLAALCSSGSADLDKQGLESHSYISLSLLVDV